MQQPLGVPEFKPVPVIRVMEGGRDDAMNGDERPKALLKQAHYERMFHHHDALACWHDDQVSVHEGHRDHFGDLLREMREETNKGEEDG